MAQPLSRRRFVLDWAAIILSATGASHWLRLEAEDLEIVHRELTLPALRSEIRLVQLSDFHASPAVRFSFLKRAVSETLGLEPDLICLTGDFTTAGLRDWTPLLETLRPLARYAPTFACLGNHDGPPLGAESLQEQTIDCLRSAGVQLLHNAGTTFEKAGSALHLVGTGDYWMGPFNLDDAFAGQPATLPTVLLTHNPDARPAILDRRWDLTLCGHTHGGQINLPGMYGRFCPVRDRSYVAGPYLDGQRTLYINRGLGSIGGVRYGARPEITVFHLQPAS